MIHFAGCWNLNYWFVEVKMDFDYLKVNCLMIDCLWFGY